MTSNKHSDDIAGIATATGGAIGIIRISGANAAVIAGKVFVSLGKSVKETRKFYYGHVRDESGAVIDEAMLVIMSAPKTYTRENIAEIHCHGGGASLRRCFGTVIKAGARAAEPGEFTKRAFLNGRLDLARAEAVMDTISASGAASLRLAARALEGDISDTVKRIYNSITDEIAAIETFLDSPEHAFGEINGEIPGLANRLKKILSELENIGKSYNYGRIIKEGINTAIIGKPNVGKSSILNALAQAERAIVTDIPGTTRDVLTESVTLNESGVVLNVMDTAGIRRDVNDPVEKIGAKKAALALEHADLALFVVDGSKALDDEDFFVYSQINAGKEHICVINKSDLPKDESVLPALGILNKDMPIINISAKSREGLDLMSSAIEEIFTTGHKYDDNSVIITNARHWSLLTNAAQALKSAIDTLERGLPEDLAATELMDALSHLGAILGLNMSEDIINTIFSKFCIGK